MPISHNCQAAADAAVEAMLDITAIDQDPTLMSAPSGLMMFTEILDHLMPHLPRNVSFFKEVLEKCGATYLCTVEDVWGAVLEQLKNLRTIEVFGRGDFVRAKRFCEQFSTVLLAESWERRTSRRYAA
jgi:hypothetical protein